MSSRVPKKFRVSKGERKCYHDFSPLEQKLIRSLVKNFDTIVIHGSRVKGTFEDDSDIDVGITDYTRNYHNHILKNMSTFYGIKIDAKSFENAELFRGSIVISKGDINK